jgi:hypothetical protein
MSETTEAFGLFVTAAPPAPTLSGAELVPIVPDITTNQTTTTEIAALAYANSIVAALPAAAALTGTELVAIIQSAAPVRTTTAAIAALATPLVGTAAILGKTADIALTNLCTITENGVYLFTMMAVTTTADVTAVNPNMQMQTNNMTNGYGTNSGGGLTLTAVGQSVNITQEIPCAAGQIVQYSVLGGTYGTSIYDLYVSVVKLT